MSRQDGEAPLSQRTLRFLDSLIASETHRPPATRNALEDSLLERVKQHIEQHLESSELSPESICRQVGVSRSQLYRLFLGTGGVASYIRMARLIKARAALTSLPRQRISNVAYKYGFSSHAHFSRVFKQHFGHTPWECMAASFDEAIGVADDKSAGDFSMLTS